MKSLIKIRLDNLRTKNDDNYTYRKLKEDNLNDLRQGTITLDDHKKQLISYLATISNYSNKQINGIRWVVIYSDVYSYPVCKATFEVRFLNLQGVALLPNSMIGVNINSNDSNCNLSPNEIYNTNIIITDVGIGN